MSLDKIKVQKTAQNLLGHFDPAAKIVLEIQEGVYRLNIESEMAAMLIGRRGQNLQALEHILRLMLAKESEEFKPIIIDISGYRASRSQELETLAKELAQKVLATGASENLPPMNSYERRLIHLYLDALEGIETESVGIEPDRKIVIKKK